MWKTVARVLAHGAVALGVLAAPASAGPGGDLITTVPGKLITVSAAGEVTATIVRDPAQEPAAWSPDGARIAFEKNGIFVANADGSDLRMLAHAGQGASRPVWVSPSEIALHRDSALWLVAIEGGQPRKLAAPAFVPLAMQPQGSLLLHNVASYQFVPKLTLVDVRSGVTRRLPARAWEAAWSPDGRELALAGPRGLELLRPDGTEVRKLVSGSWVRAPLWSPDGSRIAFTTFKEFPELYGKLGLPTRSDIWTVSADGAGLIRLTGINGDRPFETVDQWGSGAPSWWPDGSRLLFASGRAGDDYYGAIWMMNADGTCEQRWAPGLRTLYVPKWRPGAKPASSRLECLSVTVRLREDAPPAVPLYARGPDGAELGARDPLPLRVVVRNDGTRPVRDLRLTLTATDGSLAVPARGCGRGQHVVCELGTLEPAAEIRFVVEARARASLRVAAVETFTATATYADASDIFPADDTASAFVQVLPCDILGTWGNDRLVGTRRGERICGRPGSDRIDGGPGDDRIDAGSGYDSITGGPGRDSIFGGGGFDAIFARDGERDVVECGAQGGSVIADRIDKVARDCERVSRR